jgi:dienelactone hydrolase
MPGLTPVPAPTGTAARPSGSRPRPLRVLAATALAGALAAGGITSAAPATAAGFQRGPNPTVSSISAPTGPFTVAQFTARNVSGFGNATIYHPTDTSRGTFGIVAIAPGFFSFWSQLSWLGPRLASQGFVVVGMDTTSLLDLPSMRGDQLAAALNNAVNDSRLAGIVDPNRRAMAGWSMGGGGALDQAIRNPPNLKAAIGIAPWEVVNGYASVRVPSLVITGQSDTVATNGAAYYASIAGEKAFVELAGANHFFTTSANTAQAAAMIAWLKRFVDEDTRYTQFLCPGPPVSTGVSASRTTCPY